MILKMKLWKLCFNNQKQQLRNYEGGTYTIGTTRFFEDHLLSACCFWFVVEKEENGKKYCFVCFGMKNVFESVNLFVTIIAFV